MPASDQTDLRLNGQRAGEGPLPADYLEPHWCAACTASRQEKSIARQMAERNLEHLLPLYRTVHRWKDRNKELELPLFPGYVFVHITLKDRLRVLTLPGVTRFVGFNGRPAVIPDCEIRTLCEALAGGSHAEPHPYLKVGRRARICRGPMAGIEGVLIRKKGKLRFVLSVDLITSSVAVEVEEADIGPV